MENPVICAGPKVVVLDAEYFKSAILFRAINHLPPEDTPEELHTLCDAITRGGAVSICYVPELPQVS